MCRVTKINETAIPAFQARTPQEGRETDLVLSFMDRYVSSIAARQKESDIAVFLEPSIDSGYPDIVIAVYSKGFMQSWSESRSRLTDRALKVLSCLIDAGSRTTRELTEYSGFSASNLEHDLLLLQDAGLVTKNAQKWKAERKSKFFGLKRLIAIEAKINSSKQAIYQAFCNRRFSSESYVLLASESPTQATQEKCRERGIGLLAGERGQRIIKAVSGSVPVNYTSLKFNEWIARSISKEVAHDI